MIRERIGPPTWFRPLDAEAAAEALAKIDADDRPALMRAWLRHADPEHYRSVMGGSLSAEDLHLIADFWPGPPPHPPAVPARPLEDVELVDLAITMSEDPWWEYRRAAVVLAEVAHANRLAASVLTQALWALTPANTQGGAA